MLILGHRQEKGADRPSSPQDSSTSFVFHRTALLPTRGAGRLRAHHPLVIYGPFAHGTKSTRPVSWAQAHFAMATYSETHTGTPKTLREPPGILLPAAFPLGF